MTSNIQGTFESTPYSLAIEMVENESIFIQICLFGHRKCVKAQIDGVNGNPCHTTWDRRHELAASAMYRK